MRVHRKKKRLTGRQADREDTGAFVDRMDEQKQPSTKRAKEESGKGVFLTEN